MVDRNSNDNGTAGASITPRGRFNRIETALERIEEKLDSKGSISRIETLDAKVAALERIDSNRVAAADALLTEKENTAAALKIVSDIRYHTLRSIVATATIISLSLSGLVAVLTLLKS